MSIGELLTLEEGTSEKFQNHWLGYTETKENPALRNDIAKIYSHISFDEILECEAVQEPIFLYCHAVLKPQDEVIVQFPCYQSVQV